MKLNEEPTQYRTLGVMADELGQPLHRVQYIVKARGIRETARAGTLRLFNREALARVKSEIEAMDARRCEGVGDG